MGTLIATLLAVGAAVLVLVGLFVLANRLCDRLSPTWEAWIRPWIFVGPTVLCVTVGLFVPTIRTIYMSVRGGDEGDGGFTLDHYRTVLGDDSVISFHGVSGIWTSRLFFAALLLVGLALVLARRQASRRPDTHGAVTAWRSPAAAIALALGVLALLFAVFTTLRGVIWNNLWWLVTVTVFATSLGLGLAALADRSRGRAAVRTLLLLPLVISMVSASVIWSYVYGVPRTGQAPGGLNAVLGWFGAGPVDVLHGPDVVPWNNVFLMVVMIWIETGFAMVVLSAAISAIPDGVVEAARVDGARHSQVFWRITLPQIVPALLVVIADARRHRRPGVRPREGGHRRAARHGRPGQPDVREPPHRRAHDVEHLRRPRPRARPSRAVVRGATGQGGAAMSAPSGVPVAIPSATTDGAGGAGTRAHRFLAGIPSWIVWAFAILWTIPTLGLLVNSFRPATEQLSSGWWTAFSDPKFTLDNYRHALSDPPAAFLPFWKAFANSVAIAVPATVLPVLLAAAAAYAFAWMRFRGRSWLFVGIVAMLVVPLQMVLAPLAQVFTDGASLHAFGLHVPLLPDLDLNDKPAAVWLTHALLGLPLGVLLLHNSMAALPEDVMEAASVDGVNHFGVFWRVALPLSMPTVAAFAVFQLLWVWNDYLVALVFLPGTNSASPLTVQLANLAAATGPGAELLPAAAVITMVVPLLILVALQRYLVRGLQSGSLRG